MRNMELISAIAKKANKWGLYSGSIGFIIGINILSKATLTVALFIAVMNFITFYAAVFVVVFIFILIFEQEAKSKQQSEKTQFGETGKSTEQQYYQRQDKPGTPKAEEPRPSINLNKSEKLMIGAISALLISIFTASIIMLVIGLGFIVSGVALAVTNSGKNKDIES